MANTYFKFKQFTVEQGRCAMKVTTDSCLFGAWTAFQCRDAMAPKVLDIGTGTGLLSLMFSQQINCDIDAIEIEQNAFEQAAGNFNASPWNSNIRAIHADARSFVFERPYDIIISNPPFYENDLLSADSSKNKAHHDESLLLEELMTIIKTNLVHKGRFFIMLPSRRAQQIENICNEAALAITYKTMVRQSTRHDPFRIMLMGAHSSGNNEAPVADEIAVKDNADNYTPVFQQYLRDYYLYLQ